MQNHGNPLFFLRTKMSSEEIQFPVPLLPQFSSNLFAAPRTFARLSKLVENEDIGLNYVASIVKIDPQSRRTYCEGNHQRLTWECH